MAAEHTSKQFDADMDAIRRSVLAMGGLVEAQIARAGKALKATEADVVDQVFATEAQINRLQMEIDQQCTQMIARRQPAAGDLRLVMTFVKTVNDLERIGDETKKVVYKAEKLYGTEWLAIVRRHDVGRMLDATLEMLQMALDALVRLDVRVTAEVAARDSAVDAQFLAIMRQLISYMMEDPRTISAALEIVLIAKAIERIGDHAKNISEYVVNVVMGKDLRHATLEQIREQVGGD